MADKYYEVERKRFEVVITEVKLEDAIGDVYTQQELKELLGVSQYWGAGSQHDIPKIQEAINVFVAKAIDRQSKTIVIDDVELLEFLTEQAKSGYNMNHFIEGGYRRVGDRLFMPNLEKRAAKVREPNKKDYGHFIAVLTDSINKNGRKSKRARLNVPENEHCHSFELSMVYHAWNRVDALELLKKLIKWEEITWTDRDDQAMIDRCKQIWDNPSLFEADVAAEED